MAKSRTQKRGGEYVIVGPTFPIGVSGTGDVATDSIWQAKGDLAVGTGASASIRLAVGADTFVLVADSAEVSGLKWVALGGGGDALTGNPLSQFAATTSAQLAGVISDETGTGALVFAQNPVFSGFSTAYLSNSNPTLAITNAHSTVDNDASGGSIVLDLPTAVGIAGRVYNFKKSDASVNTVTIDGNAAETIDGTATKILTNQYQSLTVQSNGANWIIL